MAEITAKLVKELRDRTGAGMMDCKKALGETNGDIEKAIDLLREKGIAKAAKKSGRTAAEGLIFDGVSADNKTAVVLEFNSETDFVAKNDEFKALGAKMVEIALRPEIKTVEDLKAAEIDGVTVETTITNLIAKIGENMSLRRFEKVTTEGFVTTYNHLGGKLGVIVEMTGEATEANITKAKDIAMHVAAMDPKYVDRSVVTTDDLDREREISRKQLEAEGKPAQIIEKILVGKMNKFYEESCLVDQIFVKAENKETVAEYAGDIKVVSFARYKVGEGIEKEEVDFAAEVAAQLNA
ncbi:MAG: translation elongation factor Ts [Cetobacterium somerae]|jgi:elongation factor Ts|uniref:Elongation factor Ts n=1 Tax=Cetobacterium somerae ATCC BAA-474 TaxID=1319815 RepID=U7V353_9FUSO|nr:MULTISPECIES: translation elongation factor Ts [Cetobacterium]ERT65961.1 translation elongation factor Ts [Cetobacterium somerae ATCC BAA-474]MBC2852978.1 elongation factor Ts [Cetobacterium sp. 2G large]MCQ9627020.1 elongation factor Ts [Cetobacterium somerae]UPO96975.1 translation elongation factor Ts [Cetobacterium somerae]WVJ01156.1 translation elongation factor Ts [Cetobacterium somerae]